MKFPFSVQTIEIPLPSNTSYSTFVLLCLRTLGPNNSPCLTPCLLSSSGSRRCAQLPQQQLPTDPQPSLERPSDSHGHDQRHPHVHGVCHCSSHTPLDTLTAIDGDLHYNEHFGTITVFYKYPPMTYFFIDSHSILNNL